MVASFSTGELARNAAAALGPESAFFEDLDAAGLGEALGHSLRSALGAPLKPSLAALRFGSRLAHIPLAAGRSWLGLPTATPVEIDGLDRRFAAPAWAGNPLFYSVRMAYLAAAQCAREIVGSAAVEAEVAAKAAVLLELLIDASAPTNFLPTNPAALQRAFDTGGDSLRKGAAAMVDDLLHHGGKPRQVDTSGFEVGRNLACTPAKVVYRNELMEILQYEPQTELVHSNPLLCSPPWINKYYVMDLAPGRSFIEWAVQHGRTVFAISYRNPSKDMSGTTMDDYMLRGPGTALDVITDITGAQKVDIAGLCLGGAMTAITAAHLAQQGDTRLGTVTLLNTMLDYSEPGALGTFTDRRTVDRLETRMRREGTLDGGSMAGTFDVLRANDLIFNYVVSNWLMGQKPPAFDILAWNADSTRMPAAMHSFYLRKFYVENRLAAGTLEIAGNNIDLSAITSPAYIVSAVNDHIVPWGSAYKSVHLLSGPVRFVLGGGGHIAGIVSPPGPKAWYQTLDGDQVLPASAQEWKSAAERHQGSWWQDWAAWSAESSGVLEPPPPMGSAAHPVLADGPGSYVRG